MINIIDIVHNEDTCPNCKKNLKGEDIYQFFLNKYTKEWPYKYSKKLEDIKESIKQYPTLFNKETPNFYKNKINKMTDIELNAWYTAQSYGWSTKNPKSFSSIIGIEVQGYYDGIAFWHCPKCKAYWKRFEWSDITKLKEDIRNGYMETGNN